MIMTRSEVEEFKTEPMRAKVNDVERLSDTAIFWSDMSQRLAKALDSYMLKEASNEKDN